MTDQRVQWPPQNREIATFDVAYWRMKAFLCWSDADGVHDSFVQIWDIDEQGPRHLPPAVARSLGKALIAAADMTSSL